MSGIYGSQGDTIAETAFIWAGQLDFTLNAPLATASGTIRLGHITLNSFFERDGLTTITVNDLLKSVHTTMSLKNNPKFSLISAVVNHELVNALSTQISPAN
jgi:hypothetical protein